MEKKVSKKKVSASVAKATVEVDKRESVTRSKATKAKELKVPAEAFYGSGRRKSAIAKVWLFKGSGALSVNGESPRDAFKREILVDEMTKPLRVLKLEGKYDVMVKTCGGGLRGQADATKLGLARAILAMNEEFRRPLREENLLTRDSRVKERKKYGRKKARKGFQFRKR